MKPLFLILLISSTTLFSQNKLSESRYIYKNEITFSGNVMWQAFYFSLGISYDRAVLRFKHLKNSYLSWENSFFLRSFTPFTYDFGPTQFQSSLKYNFIMNKKLLSIGIGNIFLEEKLHYNPVFSLDYKFNIPSKKLSIGVHGQISSESLFQQAYINKTILLPPAVVLF